MVFDFGIVGESQQERSRIMQMNQKASDDIRSTFIRVRQTAVEHGATLRSE